MSYVKKQICIDQALAGQRLDHVLSALFPNLSTRARRRLWQDWHIYIDNKARPAGYFVKAGEILNLEPRQGTLPKPNILEEPQILHAENDLIFFYKPRGLHSTKLAQGGPSLEDFLPQLLQSDAYKLCNRLDFQTSGIVVATKDETAKKLWQSMEDNGQCQKRYVALGQGSFERSKNICIDAALDTDKRKKTKVLPKEADTLRHTHFKYLAKVELDVYTTLQQNFSNFPEQDAVFSNNNTELFFMGCTIYKGARHQIRAHAAHGNFRLFNDLRYAGHDYTEECFLLHHGALHLPNAKIFCKAPWEDSLPPALLVSIKEFLQN